MSNALEIRLHVREDRFGDEYLIGSAEQIPALIDLRDTTFLVFYPKEGEKSEDGKEYATLLIRKYQPPKYPPQGSEDR